MLSITVTAQVAVLEVSAVLVAVMVAVPALTAVTLPLEETVATDESEDAHVTVWAVRSVTVAVSVEVFPTSSVSFVALKVTAALSLVTVIVSVLVELPTVAVSVAVPAATPVTVESFTVATDVLSEVHVTVRPVGSVTALSVAVPPTAMDVLSALTLLIVYVVSETVIFAVSVCPSLNFAVMTAVLPPVFPAVTSPESLTDAIDVSDELQVTFVSLRFVEDAVS